MNNRKFLSATNVCGKIHTLEEKEMEKYVRD